MKPDVTSRHLRTSTELTVIAPIKQGFIEYVDTITYASRLRMLLNVLFELRKGADERSSGVAKAGTDQSLEYVGPLERLQTLHFVQWAIIDNDTRLMLNVTFDRSWETYIRDIVDIAGPLLDIILCHCADYNGHSTNLGYEKFAEWVREHQVANSFFYASEPSLTSDDHRFHIKLAELPFEILDERAKLAKQAGKPAKSESLGLELEKALAKLRVEIPKPTSGTLEDLQRIAGALFDLRRYYSGVATPSEASYLSASARQDLLFYDEVAYLLLCGFEAVHFKTEVEKPSAMLLAMWYRALKPRKQAELRAEAAQSEAIPRSAVTDIQRGLLAPFEHTTHGCLALVQWQNPVEGARFLKHVLEKASFEGKPLYNDTTINLALTFRGLKSLDLTEQELRAFPKEFREGMEARSGILGDIKASHPSTWKLPNANWVERGHSARRDPETVALGSVDAVLIMHKSAPSARDCQWSNDHPLASALHAIADATSVRVLHVQALRREFEGGAMLEHFGFRDDISQPHVAVAGAKDQPVLARDRVAPGEIVLGYPNARGEVARFAVDGVTRSGDDDLLKNGSFLVLRKLKQDSHAFDAFLKNGEALLGKAVSAEEIAAQMMGRYRGTEGKPLGTDVADGNDKLKIEGLEEQQKLNRFDFSKESGCPFHAHIRRVNPRDEVAAAPAGKSGEKHESEKTADSNTPQRKTPRILRRSFPYGPVRSTPAEYEDASIERGLMFMAVNASIADQYEILQRWVSGGNSTGLASSLADLISGSSTAALFPVQVGDDVRWLPAPEQPLVELEWGMYTFMPSQHAVKALIKRAEADQKVAVTTKQLDLLARGVVIVNKLQALPESVARVEWKRLLENRDAAEDTRAIWGAVLKVYGGALRTPYGVLVAGERNVYEVLRSSDTYSVREYWHRMVDSIGPMHLGMDPKRTKMPEQCATARDKAYEAAVQEGTYDEIAAPMNRAIAAVTADVGFDSASNVTKAILNDLPVHPDTKLVSCDLRDLAAAVLQKVSEDAFGMPQPKAGSSLADFRQCSAYVFTPNPEPWVGEGAREAGKAIRTAYRAGGSYATLDNKKLLDMKSDPTVARATDPSVPDAAKEARAANLKGAAFGFLAATLGSVLSALTQWLDNGELWRLQQALETLGDAKPGAKDQKRLEESILRAMQRAPIPQVLHRQVVQAAQLGPVSLVPGDRVVAALATVAADAPNDLNVMFGGDYDAKKDKPVHACPGRAMALGVMTGLVWTVLRQYDIRRVSEVSPLKVTFLPRA